MDLMQGYLGPLGGIPIYTSEFLTKTITKTVDRTTKERWLSWPWKPWVKTKVITEVVPDTQAFMAGGVIYCHPTLLSEISRIANGGQV